MTSSGWNYQKNDGLRDQQSSRIERPVDSGIAYVPIRQTLSDYSKRDGILPSDLIVVISGGEVKERKFLNEILERKTFPRITIRFITSERKKGGLTPTQMIERYSEMLSDDNFLSESDEVFMLTDVDHYYDELSQIIKNDGQKEVKWIISNPCFEIWLYHCHFDFLHEDVSALEQLEADKRSSTLKNILDRLLPGGIDPRKSFMRISDGIANARNSYKEDVNQIPFIFSTSMYIFADRILSLIGKNNFYEWIEARNRQIQKYREGLS